VEEARRYKDWSDDDRRSALFERTNECLPGVFADGACNGFNSPIGSSAGTPAVAPFVTGESGLENAGTGDLEAADAEAGEVSCSKLSLEDQLRGLRGAKLAVRKWRDGKNFFKPR
jgi:hypothetical protein